MQLKIYRVPHAFLIAMTQFILYKYIYITPPLYKTLSSPFNKNRDRINYITKKNIIYIYI
jgi:hypothetical protein